MLLTKLIPDDSIDRYYKSEIHKTPLPKKGRFVLKFVFKLMGKQAKLDPLREAKQINKKISDRVNSAIIKGCLLYTSDAADE